MNTWAAHAALAHATLISGIGPAPAFGSVSLYSFALGASAAVLALLIVRSPKQLSFHWRSGRVRQRGAARKSSASEPDGAVLESIADAELAADLTVADPADDGEAPCALVQASTRRTSRLRQRIDLMLLQMLGDDDDQPQSPGKDRQTEPAKPVEQPQRRKHAPRHAAQRPKG